MRKTWGCQCTTSKCVNINESLRPAIKAAIEDFVQPPLLSRVD